MSALRVVDLHPEELLERDALGELDDAERVRLEAHLARCATCRFERQLRADFGDELDAVNAPLAPVGLVAEVLARASGPSLMQDREVERDGDGDVPVSGSPRPSHVPSRAGRRRSAARALWMLSAAALLLLAGGAAAAIGLGGRGWPALLGGAPHITDRGNAVASNQTPKRHLAAAAPLAAQAPEAPVAPMETTQPIQAEPGLPVPAATHAASVTSAEQLFDAETTARRHGDYARAVALHRELSQRFPRSRQAQVSRATVGHLLLERGNPTDALENFDAYLAAGSGNLGEEAMVGRATALDRLGRTAEASIAWRALLAAFPDTPYAAHAKARVESLTGN